MTDGQYRPLLVTPERQLCVEKTVEHCSKHGVKDATEQQLRRSLLWTVFKTLLYFEEAMGVLYACLHETT